MILAAGLGTRLRPLTGYLPKPLFPVLNEPLIQRIACTLCSSGFFNIYINLYHLGHMVEQRLCRNCHACANARPMVRMLHEDRLLGTGGGIANIFHKIAIPQPMLVINGDVVTNLDLEALWQYHLAHPDSAATLVLHKRDPWNKVGVSGEFVTSFEDKGPGSLAFTGISVFSEQFLSSLSVGPGSRIDALSRAMGAGAKVRWVHGPDFSTLKGAKTWIWEDIGSPPGYLMAHERLMESMGSSFVGPPGVETMIECRGGWVCMGRDIEVEENVSLERCVVWPRSVLKAGSSFKDTVITPYGMLCG